MYATKCGYVCLHLLGSQAIGLSVNPDVLPFLSYVVIKIWPNI